MAKRIETAGASSSKSLTVIEPSLPDTWLTVAEAPYFSQKDTARTDPEFRDPNDPDFRLRGGRVRFLAPIIVTNTDTINPHTVEFRVLTEDGDPVQYLTQSIPAGKGDKIVFVGVHLTKERPDVAGGVIVNEEGHKFQVRASAPGVLNLWASLSEAALDDHLPKTSPES